MNIEGYLDGDICNRNGCLGVIKQDVENCSCHICPPCSQCVDNPFFCSLCNWSDQEVYKAGDQINGFIYKNNYVWERRKLDSSKIDYYVISHTNSSQICEGVYPEGTSIEDVRKLVDGTFGGRFEYFSGGKFKFVAYTD